jgi:hypothetical membrane protein
MRIKTAAQLGMLAGALFFVLLLVIGGLTPGYDQTTNAVSELGMSGAAMALAWNVSGFGVVGALAVLAAIGLNGEFRRRGLGIVIPLLADLAAVSWALLGMFPAAPGFTPSTETTLHFTLVLINYVAFVAAALAWPFSTRRDVYWRSFGTTSVALGVVALASFLLPPTLIAPGLSQRLGIGAYFVWVVLVSWRLYRAAAAPQVG